MTPIRQAGEETAEAQLPKDFKELGELAHLLFEWPIRQAPRLALPGCILIAAIIQTVMVVLFSISYTTPSEVRPFSPQIYFIPADSAVARQIGPWLEANDPAVFSPQYDTRGAIPAPPPLKYRPSYEEPPPPMRPLPAEAANVMVAPLLPQMGDMLRKEFHRLPAASFPAPAVSFSAQKTVVHWQDGLADRTQLPSPVDAADLSPPCPAQPALFEVGVSEDGVPMHCVLLDSSGDSATDEAGSVWIHAQRFKPAPQSSWGRVLILWGSSPAVQTTAASPAKP